MKGKRDRRYRALERVAAALERAGANLTIHSPGAHPIRIGARPEIACVRFHTEEALEPLRRHDHLALAEAYLDGEIDVEGDFAETMRITELIQPDPSPLERLRFMMRLLVRDRKTLQRESVSFHYDISPDFFLPWLDRWRSYSHGFYESSMDSLDEAQTRKLRFAFDALGLAPGMDVFDMGGGWGSFLEFAGCLGVRVHSITISEQQYQFIRERIQRHDLPCTIKLVDFLDYQPSRQFDGAVFMGAFEHFADYPWTARFLRKHLKPGARLYSDFCAHDKVHQVGAFLAKYIWPGTATYVDPSRLVAALEDQGFTIKEFVDDTTSYAATVSDWADSFERAKNGLAQKWGERRVRAFILYLRASQYYFERNKVQAYHLVAARPS